MPDDVTIRGLEPADRAAWEPLFRGYIEFYQAAVADDVIGETWARLLSPEPEFHIGLGAVDGEGRLVGIAHILFHRSTWSKSCYCYLEDLFVDPGARTRGIGRKLIEAVYAEADRRGANLLGDPGIQLSRSRPLRPGRDQEPVHPIPAVSAGSRLTAPALSPRVPPAPVPRGPGSCRRPSPQSSSSPR